MADEDIDLIQQDEEEEWRSQMLTDPDDISAQFSVFSGIEAEARNRDQIIVPENDTPLDDIITPIETVVEKKQKQIAI